MDCARNIVTANFSGGTSATTAPLWQWDYGQVLCITGIDLPAAFEVHFSTNRTGGVSTVAVGADGQVTIPNVLLTIGKNLNAWIYLSDAQGEGETEYSILIPVKARPMPETYDAEVSGEFDDVVRQVSEYAETAQTAADNAGASASAAATSASEAAASASAAETAKTTAQTAQGKAEDAQAAAETAAQTATQKAQQTAQDAAQAALDAGRAESAAGRAEAAKTGAESAKTDAETAAQGAAASASAASASASSAGQAATSAGQSATAAAGSATTAENAAQTATTKAGEASASATAANTAKTAAQTAQTGAEAAKDTAAANATTATAKAAEAAQSASSAAQSKTDAEAAATRAETAAASLTVDDALSDSSVNPVQNKVITGAITDVKSAIDALKITDTASGAIASFPDGAAIPMEGLTVEMSPIQDLHGQDAPYPAGGGKNLMAPIAYSGGGYNLNIGTVLELTKAEPQPTVNGNTITYSAANLGGFIFKTNPLSAGTYAVHADVADTPNRRLSFYVVGSSDNAIKQKTPSYNTDIENRTYTVEDGDYIAFFCGVSPEGTVTLKDLQTEAGAFTSWSPYENICPITGRDSVTVVRTGGKNLLPNTGESKTTAGVTWTKNADGTITVSGTATGYSDFEIGYAKVTPDMGTITLSGIGGTTNVNWGYIALRDANNESIVNLSTGSASASLTFDISSYPNADNVRVTVKRNNNVATSGVIKPQLELGSTATAYEPYDGTSVTIQLGQTVYGGTVDVITGVMTVDRAMATFDESSDEKWTLQSINSHGIANFSTEVQHYPRANYKTACNMLAPQASPIPDTSTEGYYAHQNGVKIYIRISADRASTVDEWKAWLAQNPLQLVYGLAEPITIQLTPAQLSTLHGQNNVWSDADSVTVEYVADPKLYIARLTEPDADMIADANITSGKYFMVGNSLYLATANIASGANIVPGVNCTRTNLAAALNAINA